MAHCARCHEAGHLDPGRPTNTLVNILDLDAIARDPSLVRPGLADGSRLYTMMVRRAMPPGSDAGGSHSGPTSDEIQAVRDWIEALPLEPRSACQIPTVAPVEKIAAALRGLDAQIAADARFITLVPPPDACGLPRLMQTYREALRHVLRGLSRGVSSVELEPVDRDATIYRLSLSQMGWSRADWEALTALQPDAAVAVAGDSKTALQISGTMLPAVRADWLAHVAYHGLVPTATLTDADLLIIAPLARLWERDLDIDGAAAELSLSRDDVMRKLTHVPKEQDVLARRLIQGLISRAEFVRLRAYLDPDPAGAPKQPDGSAPVANAPAGLEMAIWSDKPVYGRGDLVTIRAQASADCHLTLIGVDGGGRATVLYPNEMAPVNLLKAGEVLSVPGIDAPYQFRLEEKGHERIVGVCTVKPGLADGIEQDFERQRFTFLGDWRAFLARSMSPAATPAPEKAVRRGRAHRARRIRDILKSKFDRPKPEQHARTAIRIEVR
jgi:hypothetical protein